jgi:hypothetical protein
MKGTTTMVSRGMNQEHDAPECPCCRLRAAIAQAFLDPDNDVGIGLLDQLLDTVESVRHLETTRVVAGFEVANASDEQDAASRVAVDAVKLVHMILDAGGEHLTVSQGDV